MKVTLQAIAASALLGNVVIAGSLNDRRHAHEALHRLRRQAATNTTADATCGCTTYYTTFWGEPTCKLLDYRSQAPRSWGSMGIVVDVLRSDPTSSRNHYHDTINGLYANQHHRHPNSARFLVCSGCLLQRYSCGYFSLIYCDSYVFIRVGK